MFIKMKDFKLKNFMCSAITFVFMLILAMPSVHALNSSGNKPINFLGYQYVDSTTLNVFFSKTTNPVKEQFKIEKYNDGSNVPISSVTIAAGSGCSVSGLSNGNTAVITPQSAFAADTLYKVTLSSTIASNNGLTLGNYRFRNDYVFYFKTPDPNGYYTGTPKVTPVPVNGDSNISFEDSIAFSVDRPVTNVDTIKSNMNLQKYVGGSWQNVITDSTFDSNPVTGAECYSQQVNDAGTCFFYTLTAGTSTTTAYNLLSSSTSYKLTIPSMTDVDGNSVSASSATFTTVAGDIPGKLTSAPTITAGTGSLSATWYAGGTAPIASQYNVYYSTDQYWGYVKANASPVSTTSYTINNLTQGTTYYIRITPVNSYGEAGYSPCGQGVPN